MAHIGRAMKNVEAPRPLKSQSRTSVKNNMMIEDLIQLIENVALTVQSGINNPEPMNALAQNLRVFGPQLENFSKDTLDRAFVTFRNASQDERLNLMIRLKLLELIELRAKGWLDTGLNSYYKEKEATNVEPETHHVEVMQSAYLSSSPTFGGGSAAAAIASVGSAQQQQLLLSPGEVIKNSGKFLKPTKIPGKTYCKDEVVIRNADSGKVMGIKGRRVHMIEELSETIISFQRVNPGAKERLVQITGPNEEKINYAKHLIEDTIRRNASPVRLDPSMGSAHGGEAGSNSSLASSNSDDVMPRTPGIGSSLSNRLSFNSAQNFMPAAVAAQQMPSPQLQMIPTMMTTVNNSTPNGIATMASNKLIRPNQQVILQSYEPNDATLEDYKYSVNVGNDVIKITGNNCELVRVAKLVLDDYFSSANFLASMEAGSVFDGTLMSPLSTPSTPMGPPQFLMGTATHITPSLQDSGVGLNYLSSANSTHHQEVDDEVFSETSGLTKSGSQSNGLARSRRSHFSRKDSTPEANTAGTSVAKKIESVGAVNKSSATAEPGRCSYTKEMLLYFADSNPSWPFPPNWERVVKCCPSIIRNEVQDDESEKSYNESNSSTNINTPCAAANNTDLSTNDPISSERNHKNGCNARVNSIQTDEMKLHGTKNSSKFQQPEHKRYVRSDMLEYKRPSQSEDYKSHFQYKDQEYKNYTRSEEQEYKFSSRSKEQEHKISRSEELEHKRISRSDTHDSKYIPHSKDFEHKYSSRSKLIEYKRPNSFDEQDSKYSSNYKEPEQEYKYLSRSKEHNYKYPPRSGEEHYKYSSRAKDDENRFQTRTRNSFKQRA